MFRILGWVVVIGLAARIILDFKGAMNDAAYIGGGVVAVLKGFAAILRDAGEAAGG